MATSGSVDFAVTRTQIVNQALEKIGAIAQGETPSAEDSVSAVLTLNALVKVWQAEGIKIWTRRVAYLFTSKSQGRYTLGPNSSDHAAEFADAVFTTLSADAASGASSISVTSSTGMATADYIGVVLDDGTIDWDTISAIPGAVTLTGTLSGAAASGNAVFSYTTKIARPLQVLDAQRTNTSNQDTPMIMVPKETYERIPNKTETGKTNQVFYQPEIPDGFIHLWPEPEDSSDRMRLTCIFPIEDFDDTSNNPDLPQEWILPLIWNLAEDLLPNYAVPQADARMVIAGAEKYKAIVEMYDQEPDSIQFQPNMRYG
ncbi:MAG: hypothetical protein QF744_14975 [SAR202 cluster bacterium]|jgi:hypothetical protein|nr:hypothetical protein [SAR202 cluster bacterium]